MNKIKSKGPNIDPWGTPHNIFLTYEAENYDLPDE